MVSQRCSCGAKYRFRKSSIGKRAKCKKCGAVFTLTGRADEATIALADENPGSEPPPSRTTIPTAPSAAPPGPPKICVQCGYILDFLPEHRCPECGREYDPNQRKPFTGSTPALKKKKASPQRYLKWMCFVIVLLFAPMAYRLATDSGIFQDPGWTVPVPGLPFFSSTSTNVSAIEAILMVLAILGLLMLLFLVPLMLTECREARESGDSSRMVAATERIGCFVVWLFYSAWILGLCLFNGAGWYSLIALPFAAYLVYQQFYTERERSWRWTWRR